MLVGLGAGMLRVSVGPRCAAAIVAGARVMSSNPRAWDAPDLYVGWKWTASSLEKMWLRPAVLYVDMRVLRLERYALAARVAAVGVEGTRASVPTLEQKNGVKGRCWNRDLGVGMFQHLTDRGVGTGVGTEMSGHERSNT